MVGKVLAQYQISEKLGEGGMGVVWKARDTRLDRFVALKTLSAEKLSDPERKRRFVQEAKAASALNHPNTRVDTHSTALSVSPDGRWILYTQLDQSGSNLMLVENYQ
jgi:serine/threonine protein kinase